MKKITLLLFFLMSIVAVQAQNLLTNGDFEEGMTVWEGNGFNVQEDGGNSFNFVDVATAGEPFNVNLSQRGIDIAQGQTFTLTFDASTDAATASRTMLAGIGLFVDPFTNQSQEVTVTSDTQTFSVELVANFTSTDSRVLFDMGAATGVVVIDNVSLTLNEETPPPGGNLLENGDFEEGMTVWEGNGFNVQEDGGNSFNFVDVATAGEPFNVNLSQRGIDIAQGQTFTLTFDASTDAATASRTMLAGIGLFVDPFTNQSQEVTLTSDTQTFSVELVANFSSGDSRVLFDMGAAAGVVVIDNVTLVLNEENSGEELLDNGDFEQGMVVWEGNGFNVQEDGGNSFNFVDVATAGEPFQVNLSQRGLNIAEGQTFTLTFDASTDATTASRTMLAGIGLFVDPFTNQSQEVTVTSDTQTFSLELVANFTSADSRVLFDMGGATGVVVIDNVSLVQGTDTGGGDDPVVPPVPAPTPPDRDAATVFSLFSDAYTQQPDLDFGAFDVGTQDIETIQVEEDNVLQVNTNQPVAEFLLVDFGGIFDLSAMTHFHMDYYIVTDLSAGLIANPLWSNHEGDMGQTSSFGLTNPVTTFGEWVSIDVPLTDFDFGQDIGNGQTRDALRQFVLTLSGAEAGDRTIFIDNLYLHQNTTLSTEEFTTVQVSAFPNPTTNRWTISTESMIDQVVVYDIVGKKVLEINPNTSSTNLDASALKTGVYIAKVTTAEGTQSLKLLKQ